MIDLQYLSISLRNLSQRNSTGNVFREGTFDRPYAIMETCVIWLFPGYFLRAKDWRPHSNCDVDCRRLVRNEASLWSEFAMRTRNRQNCRQRERIHSHINENKLSYGYRRRASNAI